MTGGVTGWAVRYGAVTTLLPKGISEARLAGRWTGLRKGNRAYATGVKGRPKEGTSLHYHLLAYHCLDFAAVAVNAG